mgnify:FL=1
MKASNDQIYALLGNVPLLMEMEVDARWQLARLAEVMTLRAGDVLFRKGDVSDGGYVIVTGAIAFGSDTNRAQVEKTVGPKCLVGEIALVSRTERAATAVAHEPSMVARISRRDFVRVMREYPQSALRVRNFIACRLRYYSNELETARSGAFEGEPVPSSLSPDGGSPSR